MSGKYFPVAGKEEFAASHERTKAMLGHYDRPVKSKLIALSATGTTQAVTIPAGAYVYRVGVLAKTAVASGSGDVDIGDGSVTDRYIDGLSALAVNDIMMSGTAGTAAADPIGGHYYSASDTIDVVVTATPSTGSIYVLAWYDIFDVSFPV